MSRIRHDQRAREDVAKSVGHSEALDQGRVDGLSRRASIADAGKLMTLKYGGNCVVCGEHIEAGTEAVWYPSRQIAHLRYQCPATPEYRTEPTVTLLPTAGREQMWRGAGWKPRSRKRKAVAHRVIGGGSPTLGKDR